VKTLFATMRVALRALRRNLLRSFLTALGIIIGTSAVIAMVGIGEGAKARVEETFAAMGTNLLILIPGSSREGGMRGGAGTMPTLTWDDLRAIQTEVPSVRAAAAVLRVSASVVSEESNWTTSVTGTSPEYFDIRGWPVKSGATLTQSDVDTGAKVVLLGQTVVDRLYGTSADPIGQTVRIKNIPFTVIGVLAKKGQSPMGQDYDDTAIVPVSTFRTKIQGGLKNFLSGTVMIGSTSPAMTARAEREVAALLRERHRIAPGMEDDFSIRNLTEMASAQAEGTRTMTTLLAVVALISLVVGGIGIMNIMLVSVTERTREIGVRMAVGAKPGHILMQFLVESLVLALFGGIVGVALGILVGEKWAASYGWSTLLRPDVIVLAVSSSAAVGVVFGLYPAVKASRLDPIIALRTE
jgi:putative ABC transport system permease protein